MVAAPVDINMDDPVTAWQIKQYYLQGFSPKQVAVILADRCFDHHDTEHLLKRGCTHEQVIEITRG